MGSVIFRKKGQMIILIALILISILSLTMFTASRSYSPSPVDPSIPQAILRQECRRAVLNALANASQRLDDSQSAFQTAVERQLKSIEQGHFGASIFFVSSPTVSILDGCTEVHASLNVSYALYKVNWVEECYFSLRQQVGTVQAEIYGALQIVKLTMPITLTLNGKQATFKTANVTSFGEDFQCVLIKNYGDGQFILEASIPYAGSGTYDLSLRTIDINGVRVSSNFAISL